jgi:polysaccharide deacetylase 2 family uncharacterized protein YibQ
MARRGDRPPIGLSWIVTWPVSAVFAALVFLASQELRHPTRDATATSQPAAPLPGGPGWATGLPARIEAVDAALQRAKLRLPKPVTDERGSGPLRWTHRLYVVALREADQSKAEQAIEALRGVDPGLAATAENTTDGTDVKIGLDGLLVSTLRFRWGGQETPKPVHPRLAIVIGPLGDDLRVARQVVEIDGPIALGVRPFRPFSSQVAELGRMFDRQVFVQLDANPEPIAGMGAAAGAASRLNAALASVPQAVGVAWHPTEASPADPQLLAAVAQHQLAFIGNRGGSTPAAAPAVAGFGEGEPETIAADLSAALEKARSDGGAIAIGSPTDASLAALNEALPQWRAGDVELVPVTALAAPSALSAR